jgi:hypothetical protein
MTGSGRYARDDAGRTTRSTRIAASEDRDDVEL